MKPFFPKTKCMFHVEHTPVSASFHVKPSFQKMYVPRETPFFLSRPFSGNRVSRETFFLTAVFFENDVSRETSIFMLDFSEVQMSTRRQFVQMSTCRHFRKPRHTALPPAIRPHPQPHSAFERCGRPLPSSSRIIRMLRTLVQRQVAPARWRTTAKR